MDRRQLLRSLLWTPLAAWLPASANLASSGVLLLQESPLAGFQYYEGQTLWPRLRQGQPLTLRRRPDNAHDPRAVEVWWNSRMLGHLPRADNCAVSQLLDRGAALSARIASLRESADPWERVRVAVGIA